MAELHTILQRENSRIKVDLYGSKVENIRTQSLLLADHMRRTLERRHQEPRSTVSKGATKHTVDFEQQSTLWTTGSSIWMMPSDSDEDETRDDIMRRNTSRAARAESPLMVVREDEARIKPPTTSMPALAKTKKKHLARTRTEEQSLLYDPTGLDQFEQQLLLQFGNNNTSTPDGVIPNPYIWNKDPIDAMKTYNRVRKPNTYQDVPKRAYGKIGRRETIGDDEETEYTYETETVTEYETVTLPTIEENWIMRKPSGTEDACCMCCFPGDMR